ncbi:MAG: acyl-CoA thioesterase [Proteobacteria bacterium]|nr:acyl-CoA thioesterase [Pseudomonadota bacterium]MBU1716724.1 acyl-CoA thioesterase [Pseudomonadota bacterium]
MGFAKSYFTDDPSDPVPLIVKTKRRVRFEEVDMLGIVWHGNYVSFLDDGRVALGDRFPAVSYARMQEERMAAPIVQLHIDYQAPLIFGDIMQIETTLHWTDALRLNFSYRITKEDGRPAIKAYTVQLFTDLQGAVLLIPPVWVTEFREQWKSGKLA